MRATAGCWAAIRPLPISAVTKNGTTTASIDTFSYGIADRGASIRVPHSFANSGYKGYLEDRRPNSQGDPYQIASQILKTIAEVPTGAKAAAA